MIKRLIYIFPLLIAALNGHAQLNPTKIIYKAEYVGSAENQVSQSAEQKEIQKQYKENFAKLKLEMCFNNNILLFQPIQVLEESGNMYYDLALNKATGNKIYFKDFNTNEAFYKTEFQGDDFIVKTAKENFNWTVTSESKTIGGFKCLKANGFRKIPSSMFTPEKNITIEAWFCPEIPMSIGPCGYDGLPGVILSVASNNIVIYASEIQPNQNIEIKKPEAKTHFDNEKDFQAVIVKKFNQFKDSRG